MRVPTAVTVPSLLPVLKRVWIRRAVPVIVDVEAMIPEASCVVTPTTSVATIGSGFPLCVHERSPEPSPATYGNSLPRKLNPKPLFDRSSGGVRPPVAVAAIDDVLTTFADARLSTRAVERSEERR